MTRRTKQVEKILLTRSPRQGRHGKPVQRRRATNEEIINDCVLERGFVRMRMQFHIWNMKARTYSGYRGRSLIVDLKSADEARSFLEKLFAAAQVIGQQDGIPVRCWASYQDTGKRIGERK